MSSLTAIFGHSEEKSHDTEKLLQLYWNRAELKKEFAGMRKEQFRLQDRIKQQEGATARLQQKLDHIENLLIDPEWVFNVVVFYQLRALAIHCQSKLATFAEQLKRQREQRQHNNVLTKWNEQRTNEARATEQEMLQVREQRHLLEDQLQSERQRLMNMSGLFRIFRRRKVTAILDGLAEQIDLMYQEEASLAQAVEEIRSRKPPDHAGLDIPTKRSINLMILSFAQQLYIQFGDDELAAMARESSEKSAGALNYGNRDDCNRLLDRIGKRTNMLDRASDHPDVLQRRAKMIGAKAAFLAEFDTVPAAGTAATLYRIDGSGLVREGELDVIAENYWKIGDVLSR